MKKVFWTFALLIGIGVTVGLLHHTSAQPSQLPSPPLKELARKHNLEVGNFAIRNLIREKQYSDILTGQFDFVLADNTPNWYFTDGGLRPSPTTYNFEHMDEVMSYAKRHNMPVQAHHFLWGEEKWLPEWLKNGNYTKEQLLDIIRDHILTVGGRYRGQIREWTVVNEAFTRGQHLYDLRDWWGDHVGDQSYIDQAFIWARQADPGAKLILNDFGNEGKNSVSDAMYEYVKSAKARGVPIDGLGMQMHIDARHRPSKEDVVRNMKRFAALGVGIYVTEFDVNMSGLDIGNKAKDQIAADMYYEMTRACIESRVCHSFAQLGITDKETWYNYMGNSDNARPLMFDENYRAKPAFYSFRHALEQR